jgi:type IV pilus assembly protein PilV
VPLSGIEVAGIEDRIHEFKSSMNRSKQSHQRGFTLIEAMVALVVLSVGMIGVAALHGQGLSAARSAQFRSVAVNLSADMADRIRVNRVGGVAYAGAIANNNCDPSAGGGVDCNPAQMAAHELFLWNQQVQNSLPNGQWNIVFNGGTNPPSYTISVLWDEVGAPVNPVQHQSLMQLPTF